MPSSFGPLSPEEMQQAIAAPHGAAVKIIRQHDPMWGRAHGEAIKWKVRVTQEVVMEAFVEVEADSQEDALAAAEALDANKLSWDHDYDGPIEADYARPK